MPITANTHPETTVDKNGKQTTVHRASKKVAAGKSTRSLPAPSSAPVEPIDIPQYAVNPKGYPVTYVIIKARAGYPAL